MNRMNKVGESADPCGTPAWDVKVLEKLFLLKYNSTRTINAWAAQRERENRTVAYYTERPVFHLQRKHPQGCPCNTVVRIH